MEAFGVGKHDAVELLPLVFLDGAALEGFKVEADGGDGCFELVRDGVQVGVLALIAADLAYEKDSVEDDAGEQGGEEDDAENKQGDAALVEDDPADVQRDGDTGEQDTEDDGKGDGTATLGEVHGRTVLRRWTLCGDPVVARDHTGTAARRLCAGRWSSWCWRRSPSP